MNEGFPEVPGAGVAQEKMEGVELSPKELIEKTADLYWRNTVARSTKRTAMLDFYHSFAEHAGSQEYQDAVRKNLDFRHKDRFQQTGHFLELLQDVNGVLGGAEENSLNDEEDEDDMPYSGQFPPVTWDDRMMYEEATGGRFDDQTYGAILDTLEGVIELKNGSYLLNVRAQQCLEQMENGESGGVDKVPFRIARGVYALPKDDGLYISTTEKEARAIELRAEWDYRTSSAYYEKINGLKLTPSTMERQAKDDFDIKRELDEISVADATPHRLGIEDLSLQSANANPEQSLLDEHDFEYLQSRPIRLTIEKEFGVTLSELSLPEQFQFLTFLKTVECKDADSVKEFTGKYGTDGLRAFLSLEFDTAGGEALVRFGNTVESAMVKEVLARYAGVIDASAAVADTLQERFGGVERDSAALGAIAHDMRQHAANFLASFVKNPEIAPEQFAERLRALTQDNLIFASTFRALKTHEGVNLEQVKDLSFGSESKAREYLSDGDVERMRAIVRKNYEKYPEGFADGVVASMEAGLDRDTTRFYTLKYKDRVIGFNRFDDLGVGEDGRHKLYFGSFNVDNDFGNGKLGEAMIEQTVLKEAERAVIEADCDPQAPISQRYIESGFTAAQLVDYGGVPSLHIALDRQANESLHTKLLSQDEVAILADHGEVGERSLFRATEGAADFSPLAQGFALTRYFRRGGKTYVGFEKGAKGSNA